MEARIGSSGSRRGVDLPRRAAAGGVGAARAPKQYASRLGHVPDLDAELTAHGRTAQWTSARSLRNVGDGGAIMRKGSWSCGVLVSGFFVLVACSDESDESNDPQTPAGRGTAACNVWQGALCKWATQCGTLDLTQCNDQVTAVSCKSDQEADRCATGFSSASCTSPPSGCDIRDMADPAPAIAGCNAFQTALCDRSEECDPGSRANCLTQAQTVLDCSTVIAAKLALDQCMREVPTMSCEAPALPASCTIVFLRYLVSRARQHASSRRHEGRARQFVGGRLGGPQADA